MISSAISPRGRTGSTDEGLDPTPEGPQTAPVGCGVDDAGGRRRQRTFAKSEDAETFAATRRLELGQAAPPPTVDPNISVHAYSEHWLEHVSIKPKTERYYRLALQHHIIPALGTLRVRDMHQQHVAAFLTEKIESGKYKVGTVRAMYATLRRLLSRAKFEGIVPANAVEAVWRELPLPTEKKKTTRKRTREQVKAMTRSQLDAFLDAARADEYFPLFLTLARTGLRIGEGLALKIEDVDISAHEITVHSTLAASQRGIAFDDRLGTPKSGEERTVKMSDQLAEELRAHLVRRREQNLKRGQHDDASPWLFATSATGVPLDESKARKVMTRVLKRAKLPTRFSPHSLRHSFATLSLNAGAPLNWVANQLGHSSPQVTLDWYSWALPSDDDVNHANLLDSDRPVTSGDHATRKRARKAQKTWSRRADLNRRPADYESAALPLSYVGFERGALRDVKFSTLD